MRVRSSRGGERGASVPQPGTFVRGAEGAKGLPCFPSLPCLPGVETGRRGSFDFCPLLEKDLFPDGTGPTAALGLSPLHPRLQRVLPLPGPIQERPGVKPCAGLAALGTGETPGVGQPGALGPGRFGRAKTKLPLWCHDVRFLWVFFRQTLL